MASTIVTFAWGAIPDGAEFGTGPVPADFSSGAGGLLYLMVTTEEGTARAQVLIAEAAPVVTGALPAVSWTVGAAIAPIDLGAVVSGDKLIFGGAAYPGTSLNTVTGEITGTPLLDGAVSRVFTAGNGSGTVEIPLTGSVAPAAPVARRTGAGPVAGRVRADDGAEPQRLRDRRAPRFLARQRRAACGSRHHRRSHCRRP